MSSSKSNSFLSNGTSSTLRYNLNVTVVLVSNVTEKVTRSLYAFVTRYSQAWL